MINVYLGIIVLLGQVNKDWIHHSYAPFKIVDTGQEWIIVDTVNQN